MALEADALFPIRVDLLVDGQLVPHQLSAEFPPGTPTELKFTTPISHWFHPQTGRPWFPPMYCRRCEQEKPVFRFMQVEQPAKPGTIYFAQTEICDACEPRQLVHLVVDTAGQEFRFRPFFYADGSPILVRDPKDGTLHGTEVMDFRGVMRSVKFFAGDSCRLCTTTQPYKKRSVRR